MNKICGVYGYEKRYVDYHRMYRRCELCNTKQALKNYYNNKEKLLERRKITIIITKNTKLKKNKKTKKQNI